MQSRLNEFEKIEDYFEASNKSYESYIASHKVSKRKFLVTKYNLELINIDSKVLYKRLLFLIKNYRMFRCECVFFQGHLASLDVLNPKIIGKFIKYFYVVEPLPMATLADFSTENQMTKSILLEKLPNLLSTMAMMHSVKFAYMNISPFTIIVDGVFWLRPPSLNPYASPKNCMAPPPAGIRAEYRSANEMRFYRAPEWNANPMFCESDCWSLGAILAEYMIFAGPLFGAISINDQMIRTQMICGPAPPFLNWPPAPKCRTTVFPPIIADLLSYDPRKRPLICIHVSNQILQFIRDYNIGEEEEEIEEEEVYQHEEEAVRESHASGNSQDLEQFSDLHSSNKLSATTSSFNSEIADEDIEIVNKSPQNSSKSTPSSKSLQNSSKSTPSQKSGSIISQKSPADDQNKFVDADALDSPNISDVSAATVSEEDIDDNVSYKSASSHISKASSVSQHSEAIPAYALPSQSEEESNHSKHEEEINISNHDLDENHSDLLESPHQSSGSGKRPSSRHSSSRSPLSTKSNSPASVKSNSKDRISDNISPKTSSADKIVANSSSNSKDKISDNFSPKSSSKSKNDDNISVGSNRSSQSKGSLPKYASGEKQSQNNSLIEERLSSSHGGLNDSPPYAVSQSDNDNQSVKSNNSRNSSSKKLSYAVKTVSKETKQKQPESDYSSARFTTEEDGEERETKVKTTKTESGNSHVTFSSGNNQYSAKSGSSRTYTYSSSTDVQTETDILKERIRVLEEQLRSQSNSEESANSDSSIDPTETLQAISKLKRDLNAMDSGLLSGSCVGCKTGSQIEESLEKQEQILNDMENSSSN